MDEWVLWMIAAGVLAVGEMLTLGFFAGPIAIAAVTAAIVALAGGGVALQWIVFTVMSRVPGVLRPIARRHLRMPAQLRTGTAALVGAPAVVIDRVDRDGGTVRLAGEVWAAPAPTTRTCLRARRAGRGAQDRRRHGARTRIERTQLASLIVLIVVAVVVLFTVARGIRIVPQARAGIVERLGRYHRTLDAGLALVVPYVDRVRPLLDLREQVVSFLQPVITEDNLVIQIGTVIYFQVTDPKAASTRSPTTSPRSSS